MREGIYHGAFRGRTRPAAYAHLLGGRVPAVGALDLNLRAVQQRHGNGHCLVAWDGAGEGEGKGGVGKRTAVGVDCAMRPQRATLVLEQGDAGETKRREGGSRKSRRRGEGQVSGGETPRQREREEKEEREKHSSSGRVKTGSR